MSSTTEWDNEYARLARLASQVRSNNNKTSSPAAAELPQLRSNLLQGLTRLDQQLTMFGKNHGLSPNELQRRRRLIQGLQQQSSPFTSGSTTDPTSGSNSTTMPSTSMVAPPQSQLAMAMRQQDDLIDELAVGVGRLRDQTQLIGDEARMHVNLLGDMEQNLDAAHAGLEGETRRAAQLKEDQSVWRLQLTVAGLSVLLVLLILMGLS